MRDDDLDLGPALTIMAIAVFATIAGFAFLCWLAWRVAASLVWGWA